ncbi:MAG TPA: hypothetical protein VID07_10280 [Actinomycetes bacterium]
MGGEDLVVQLNDERPVRACLDRFDLEGGVDHVDADRLGFFLAGRGLLARVLFGQTPGQQQDRNRQRGHPQSVHPLHILRRIRS